MLNKNSRIFITGHKGLVGSSILQLLKNKGFNNLITVDKNKVDLLNQKKVFNFIKNKKIDVIINCAARVGGILANSKYPVNFFYENIQIQNNLLFAANKYKVKRFVFLGSSCIYPKKTRTPIKEDQLLSGKLEKTNEAYALAKISGIKLSEYLFNQNKLNVVCLMPTNVYGIKDNFDKFSSHVIPGMISKIIEAKKKNKKNIELLGTGRPQREFLFNDDLAEAILCVLKVSSKNLLSLTNQTFPILNVGSGENISIKKLSHTIKKIVQYKGKITFNKKFPDGTFKKNLNSNKIKKLGWSPKTSLKNGLEIVINSKIG